MVDQKEATTILYELSNKIAGGLKLTAKKDYQLPKEIKINPLTLEPYVVDFISDKSCAPICIGREISDEDVMPSLYLDVLTGINMLRDVPDILNVANTKYSYFKKIHPQLRMGILLYGSDYIPKELAHPGYSAITCNIDFIEVLGHVWDHEDKVLPILENLIQEQIKASENIARVIFGKDEFLSLRGSTVR